MIVMVLMMVAQKGEPTLTQALMLAIGGLTTAVVVLFAKLRSVDSRQEKRLDECESDRRALWQAMIDLGINPKHYRKGAAG